MEGPREERKQRSVRISVEAWAALQERTALEGKSASALCDFLLRHYLALEAKPVYELPPDLEKRTRVIYTSNPTWGAVKRTAVLQRRSASALLEQLLRGYLGLALGERVAQLRCLTMEAQGVIITSLMLSCYHKG